ncbi:MAG: prepilin-type N-terminal cleavage/methylation domain-containing protein [Planctomycetota bacterium]|nr:prepilin-type N-terminal cleavage/methylation domain-containing protein [Planctomycetota bacterium]
MIMRHGFTLLEVMLATLLSSLVLAAALGLFQTIQETDERLATRYESVAEMSKVHAVLRRAMQSLVAAPEQDAEAEGFIEDDRAANALADGQASQRTNEGIQEGLEEERDRERGRDNEEEDEDPTGIGIRRGAASEHATFRGRNRFDLGALEASDDKVDIDRDLEIAPDGTEPWRLEVVLTQSPFMDEAGRGGPVRGAFDRVYSRGAWRFQWTPLDPPGDPRILAEDLVAVWWAVLLKQGWVDAHVANLDEEYPRAVRLVLWSRSGVRNDWMFEPATIIGEDPRTLVRRSQNTEDDEDDRDRRRRDRDDNDDEEDER